MKVDGSVFSLFFDFEEVTRSGGTGDPTASDPERGAEIMRRVVARPSSYAKTFGALKPKAR